MDDRPFGFIHRHLSMVNGQISMFNYTTLDESKIEFVEIAPVGELPNGERLFVEFLHFFKRLADDRFDQQIGRGL